MSSILPADAGWERWLEERFAGYLLQDAHGAPRNAEEVGRALARLQGSASAWPTLAALAFLLDPEDGVEKLVVEEIPRWLKRVLPSTVRRIEESRGRPRGRTDWSRTLRARLQGADRTLFVGISPERTFESPATVVVRYLLERVVGAIGAIPGYQGARGWFARLAAMHAAAARAISHVALRHIEARRPNSTERQACAQSHDPTVRKAAAALAFHDRLLPWPQADVLERAVERYALAPTRRARRFEFFTLLAVLDSLDRLLPGWDRRDELVLPDRDAVAVWERGGESLYVYYDQGAPAGLHADVLKRAFGITANFRPDIRLVYEREKRSVELYVDPKCSTRDVYLVHSHAKMLAYIADRPEAFAPLGPKVILTTLRPVLVPWQVGDPVAFLDPAGCVGRPLDALLRRWLDTVDC